MNYTAATLTESRTFLGAACTFVVRAYRYRKPQRCGLLPKEHNAASGHTYSVDWAAVSREKAEEADRA